MRETSPGSTTASGMGTLLPYNMKLAKAIQGTRDGPVLEATRP